MNKEENPLAGFPVVVEVPVAWAEMDLFRHVNNTVFFRYFEVARVAYLERIGFQKEIEESGIGPILASTYCNFRRPVTYPDTVRVGARTTEIGEDRFTMEYRLHSTALDRAAAEGGGVVVAFDYRTGRRATLPDVVRRAIERLEDRSRTG